METIMNEAVVLAGVMAPVILILVQLVKSTDIDPKYLPHISILLGTIAGVVFGFASAGSLFVYGLAGFISGASASGLYDGIKSVVDMTGGNK